MKSEELKILIESARETKGISQRELAKLTGISRSTLNDLINKLPEENDARKKRIVLTTKAQEMYEEMLNYQKIYLMMFYLNYNITMNFGKNTQVKLMK